jgi:integrase
LRRGPHTLRHTFCSHLAMQGAAARVIQQLAVHASLVTTQRYMHLSPGAPRPRSRCSKPRRRNAERGIGSARGDVVKTHSEHSPNMT